MIVDTNLLLYAVDAGSPQHDVASRWWTRTLNGAVAVGLPWQSIGAFVRIVTNPRLYARPLSSAAAWSYVEDWLAVEPVWVPPATEATARIYGELSAQVDITGNLVTDAMLAAIAVEHGVDVASADADFARFPGVRWFNPLTAQ